MRTFIQILLLSFLFSSCMETKEIKVGKLNISIVFEDSSRLFDIDGAEVELLNINNGRIFIQKIINDFVDFSLEPGVYQASISVGKDKIIYNGFLKDIMINDGVTVKDKLILKRNLFSPIIIKEVYYSGSQSVEGKLYHDDQFIEIYNNSSELQDVSGLCLAVLTGSSARPSKWVDDNGNLLPYLPVSQMIWKISNFHDGDWLAPGESVVIAKTAIDHSDPSLSNSTVNLEYADYETFFAPSGKDYNNIDVENLELLWTNRDTYSDWLMNPFGPAIILFVIPGNDQDFINDESNFHVDAAGKSKTICIPSKNIIDGIEGVQSENKKNKRLRIEIDASYVFVSAAKMGYSIRRRVKEIIDGRVVYMDTNDSARDFLTDQIPMPGNNPLNIEIE